MSFWGVGAPCQNTKQATYQPEHPVDFDPLDRPKGTYTVQLLPVFSGEAFKKLVQYEVLVEMWHKRQHGRVKREWLKTFTNAERRKIGMYAGRFFRWHLSTGVPKQVSCRVNTLRLLIRAVQFFATV